MRHWRIGLRRPLFLAALLGACLLAVRWAATASIRIETQGGKITVTALAPNNETASPAGSLRAGDAASGHGLIPPGDAGSGVDSPSPAEAAPVDEPSPAPGLAGDQTNMTQEISLQETLDRLGYTVNVPFVYGGHTLQRWNDYRVSTADDSIPAEQFHGDRFSTFSMLGQQAMCAPNTIFGCIDTTGRVTELFQPDPGSSGMWLNSATPRTTHADLHGSIRFFIEDTRHTMGMGTLYSTAQNNIDHASHLLVLPALTGGTWIDEGNNRGHWEGGKSSGYLLCWEDWNDFDYQDIVILAGQTEAELPNSDRT